MEMKSSLRSSDESIGGVSGTRSMLISCSISIDFSHSRRLVTSECPASFLCLGSRRQTGSSPSDTPDSRQLCIESHTLSLSFRSQAEADFPAVLTGDSGGHWGERASSQVWRRSQHARSHTPVLFLSFFIYLTFLSILNLTVIRVCRIEPVLCRIILNYWCFKGRKVRIILDLQHDFIPIPWFIYFFFSGTSTVSIETRPNAS